MGNSFSKTEDQDDNIKMNIQDIENIENQELDEIHKRILQEPNVKAKIELYFKLFTCISQHTKKRKEGLNLYYSWLNTIHFCVNVSIITLSASSTFIQSLFHESEQNEFIKILLLSITTYSGLSLAITKFYKLDEKKEHTNSLRDRFTELSTRIKYHIDSLEPWNFESHYKNENTKEATWRSLIEKIEREYENIIDCKRELNSNYEKILEKATTKTYISKYKDKKNIMKKKQNYDNDIRKLQVDNEKLEIYLNELKKYKILEAKKKNIESGYNYTNKYCLDNDDRMDDSLKVDTDRTMKYLADVENQNTIRSRNKVNSKNNVRKNSYCVLM